MRVKINKLKKNEHLFTNYFGYTLLTHFCAAISHDHIQNPNRDFHCRKKNICV